MIYMTVCTAVIATCHHVKHTVILAILERCIYRYMMTISHKALANLFFIKISGFTKFCHRGMTLVFLLKLVDFMVDFVERTYLVERQSHNSALLGNSLKNTLANPPNSIRYELETTCFIKFLGCLDKTNVALVNKVSKGETLMLILLGNGYYKSEVCGDQLIFSPLALGTTLANLLS